MSSEQKPAQPANTLQTIAADALQKADIKPLRFVVDDLLPEGLSVLVAPPKTGKSWLSLDLSLSVARGQSFLGYQTISADCLYLALEDSYRRLQKRQEQLLHGTEAPNNCHFAIAAGTVDGALSAQIAAFMKDHPQTALVIIDVLARVRSQNTGFRTMDVFRTDYADIRVLKEVADRYNIAVLVVHHARKMRDEADIFNEISGSNGIAAAADTVFVLRKDSRADTRATLHVMGRDVEPLELVIEMDSNCHWQRIGTAAEVAKAYRTNDPIFELVKAVMEKHTEGWEGTAAWLLNEGKLLTGFSYITSPVSIGKRLPAIMHKLNDAGIYWTKRTKDGKIVHRFSKSPPPKVL